MVENMIKLLYNDIPVTKRIHFVYFHNFLSHIFFLNKRLLQKIYILTRTLYKGTIFECDEITLLRAYIFTFVVRESIKTVMSDQLHDLL